MFIGRNENNLDFLCNFHSINVQFLNCRINIVNGIGENLNFTS